MTLEELQSERKCNVHFGNGLSHILVKFYQECDLIIVVKNELCFDCVFILKK